MSEYWIKLYHEILDDPKMATMDNDLWRFVIELFLAAGKINKGGYLPKPKQISWILRRDTEEVEGYLELAIEAGIIESVEGGYTVINFEKRQAASTDKERKEQQRERDRKKQYYGTDQSQECHEVVTNRETDQNRTDTDQNRTEKPSPFELIPQNLRTPEFIEKWKDWLLYLSEKKKTASIATQKETLDFLKSNPSGVAIKMISQSIRNGWVSIQELKPDNFKAKPQDESLPYGKLIPATRR